MTNKEKYISYCSLNKLPIFANCQWLDLVSDTWDTVCVAKNDNEYFLPFNLISKYGFKFVLNFYFTPYNKIVCFEKGVYKPEENIDKSLFENIISLLPKHNVLEFDFDYKLEFGVTGYSNQNMHTNILSLAQPLSDIFDNFKGSCKRQIKKCSNYNIIEEKSGISLNLLLHKVYEKQKAKFPYPNNLLEAIVGYYVKKSIGKVFTMVDDENSVLASILVVFDGGKAYNLVCASNTSLPNSGAMNGLLWHVIQFAKEQGEMIFDFEGSMHEGINNFYKTFGTSEFNYTRLNKENKIIRFLKNIKG